MSDEILEIERIHGNNDQWRGIFTLGLKSNPRYLTVRSQQLRAKVLANRLSEFWDKNEGDEKRVPPRIAVVGGGFGGLTLAAFLAERNLTQKTKTGKVANKPLHWNVVVFERQNQLIPIQRGCSIRKLHPAIHTWPDPSCFESPNITDEEKPVSESLLDWSADTAGAVAANIVSKLISPDRNTEIEDWDLELVQSATLKIISKPTDDSPYTLVCEGQKIKPESIGISSARGTWEVDVVVFATGFGVETSEENAQKQISYWRNDDLGQAPLYGQKQRYVISGAGDGALTDLFRLCIYDFSYDRVMKEVLPVQPEDITERFYKGYKRIHQTAKEDNDNHIKELISLYTQLLRELAKRPDDVFEKLEEFWKKKVSDKKKVDGESLGYLIHAFLIKRCKKDVQVIIQVLPDFADADPSGHPLRALVNNSKSMLYNRVMAYLLWRVGAFETRVDISPSKVIEKEQWDPESVTTIIRRGSKWHDAVTNTFVGPLRSIIEAKLTESPVPLDSQSPDVQKYRLGLLGA